MVAAGLGFVIFAVVVGAAWLISPTVGVIAFGALVLTGALGSAFLGGGQPGD